jgi:hypothetical protein
LYKREPGEGKLRQRLGDRYRRILAPDMKKIRQNLSRVAELLDPLLETVGSPVPERVKLAIDNGTVRKEEFAGAFKKTTRRIVSVGRVRAGQPVEDAGIRDADSEDPEIDF